MSDSDYKDRVKALTIELAISYVSKFIETEKREPDEAETTQFIRQAHRDAMALITVAEEFVS